MSKLVRIARRHGLFVLTSGKGDSFKHEYWNKKTGKLVLVYYPTRKFWFMPGAGDRKGNANTYEEALTAALGNPQ